MVDRKDNSNREKETDSIDHGKELLIDIIKDSLRHARELDAIEKGEPLPDRENENPDRVMSPRERDTLARILEIIFNSTRKNPDVPSQPRNGDREERYPIQMDKDKTYLYPGYKNSWVKAVIPFSVAPCDDGIAVYNGTLAQSGFAEHSRGIVIPEEIDGKPVTELRGEYYGGIDYIHAPNLKRVYIHIKESSLCKYPFERYCGLDNTNKIEIMELEFSSPKLFLENFRGFKAIRKVVFHNTVCGEIDPDEHYDGEYIEGGFYGCENLKEVIGRIEADSAGAIFWDCVSLKKAPEIKIKRLYTKTFFNCRSLEKVHLCDGMKFIGDETFAGCVSLSDIYVPDTVTGFGKCVFKECRRLESVHMPANIKSISEGMFYGCSSLKKVFLSDEIEEIEADAFHGCRSLYKPWIPGRLKRIGDRAYMGCESVGLMFIPASVQEIGEQAFEGCSNLTIECERESYAHYYAEKNKLRFRLKV